MLLKSYKAQVIVFLFTYLVSMVLSAEFVLSVSMIGLLCLALFELRIEGPKVRLIFRSTLQKNFKKYWEYRAWLAVSTPILIVMVSALWSADVDYTLERLRIKLPFLILPFAFASMPSLRKKEILTILYFLLVSMTAISLYVLIDFLVNFEDVMALIGRGGHLPTPSNHIRFSLTLAMTIIAGAALCAEKFHFRHPVERWFIGGMTVFLFVFIHILSVRSGILALYVALLTLGGYFIFIKKKYLVGLTAVVVIFALPFVAYQTVPSFQLKVDYAQWDFMQFRKGMGGQYPDAERLISIRTGMDIGKKHPLLGVGAGDLKREIKRVYDTKYADKYNFRMPHNQLVSIFAGAGAVGLLVFLGGFFFPLFYRKNFRQPLFLALHAIVFTSFMMENTIENNFGVSMYLFFLLIGLNFLSSEKSDKPISA